MKRPFATVGFTSFAVLLFLAFSGRSDLAFCALVCSFVLGVLSLLKKNLRQALTVPVCLFTAAFACLLFLSFNGQKAEVQSLAGKDVEVEATVSEAPYMKRGTGRHYCVLKLETVDGKRVDGKLRLSFSVTNDGIEKAYLEIGNRVSFKGTVYVPGENEKSINRYFTGENILLGAYGAKDFNFSVPLKRGVSYYFHHIRSFVSEKLRYGFSNSIAGVLVGILTGDKSCLDDRLYDAFRVSGVAHLMAVSGLHLSVWVFFLGSVIPETKRLSKLKYILLIFAVIFVMLISGLSESVKRAGFMSIVFLLGKLSKRRSDSLNSLGLSVLLMILYNPACVLSISLQLSFLSTLGILTLGNLFLKRSGEIFGGKQINTPLKKLMRACFDSFGISISVLVFTLPVLIYTFGGISTVSAWVNMLISPVVTPLLVLSGVYVLLSAFPFASYPVAVAVKLLAQYVIFVTKSFSAVKNAFLTFEADNALLLIVAAVTVLWVCFIMLKRNGKGKLTLTAVTALICTVLIFAHENLNQDNIKLRLLQYEDISACAVQADETAVIIGELPTYEKGLFISSLEDKNISNIYELYGDKKLTLRCLTDGKSIIKGNAIEITDSIKAQGSENATLLSFFGKYLCIFSSEALQYDGSCDIIIEKCEGEGQDAVVSIAEKSFSLEEKGELTLTLKRNGKLILRGEDSWQNLMKSN